MTFAPATRLSSTRSDAARSNVIRLWALRFGTLIAGAATLAGCATQQQASGAPPEPQWAANGWLAPTPSGEPEIIGLYDARADCEAAIDDWLSRQTVGHPIHGECLPIDRR